MLREVHHR